MGSNKKRRSDQVAYGESGEGRLFTLPPIPPMQSSLPAEICSESLVDPHRALRHAALICIRESQPAYVEARIAKIAKHILELMTEDDIQATDLAYVATFSYSADATANAFAALDKSRRILEETSEPNIDEVHELYSAAIILTQASPNMSPLLVAESLPGKALDTTRVTDNIEVLCRIALCRSRIIGEKIVNGFDVIKNLAIELHSDDGAIMRPKFYESLYGVFKDIALDSCIWIEPDMDYPLSPKGFASLILTAKKTGDVTSANLRNIAEKQPSQLVLSF